MYLLCRPSRIFGAHNFSQGHRYFFSEKVKSVQRTLVPKAQKELRSFLGLACYYRRFVLKTIVIANPLHDLLAKLNHLEGVKSKKRVTGDLWLPECMEAFEKTQDGFNN